MSHHYSGPNFGFRCGDARLDLTDLYAFPKPGDPRKSILIMDPNTTAWASYNSLAFNGRIVSSCSCPVNREHLMSSCTMKAAVLESYGTPLRVSDVLRPQPSRGEVLVRIAASGVNPLDTKIFDSAAAHAHHPPPAILGLDMAGTVPTAFPRAARARKSDEGYGGAGGGRGRPGGRGGVCARGPAPLGPKTTPPSTPEGA